MSSKNASEIAPRSVLDVDPVALGRAGMDALAIAGTAVLAHYASTDPFDPADAAPPPGASQPGPNQPGITDLARLCATPDLPEEVGRVLAHALGAFGATPIRSVSARGVEDSGASVAAALTAMSQRAFDVAARRSFALDTMTTDRAGERPGERPADRPGERSTGHAGERAGGAGAGVRTRARGRPPGRGWRRQSGAAGVVSAAGES